MRNLKRALSLALAAMMLIGMMVVSAGAASKDFTDKDEITHTEAVNTLVALNVIAGKGDGSAFDPTGTLTRAEMAKLVTYVLNGGVEPVLGTKVTPTYSDIKGHWAEAYIEYCTSMNIIVGDGTGKFNPEGTLTASQCAKMLLTAMNYKDDVFGFVGNSWEINVNREANAAGLYKELGSIQASQPISRDNAAQMVYNAIQSKTMRLSWQQDMTTGQITQVYNLTGDPLFVDKFGGKIFIGTFVGNKATGAPGALDGEITVNGRLDSESDPTDNSNAHFPADLDLSNIGEQVKVLFKDGTGGTAGDPDKKDTIYGVYNTESTQVVNTTKNLIKDQKSSDAKINVDGTKYDTVADVSIITNYNVNGAVSKDADDGTTSDNSTLTDYLKKVKGDTIKFVFNSDGKITTAYVMESTLSYVSAVNSEKVSLNGIGSLKIADNEIYDGIAKDDVVVVTTLYDADPTDEDAYTIVEKAEVVSGTVTGYTSKVANTSSSKVVLDGTTYSVYDESAMLTGSFSSDEVGYFTNAHIGEAFDLYLVNGMVAAAVKTSETANNYSLVIDSNGGNADSSLNPLKIEILAADGTKTTLTVSDKSPSTTIAKGDIITYTGSESDAKVSVKAPWSGKAAEADTSFYDKTSKTVNNTVTSGDCVLFVQTEAGKNVAGADAEYKAYNIRSLGDINANGKNYTTVTVDGKIVAAVLDLQGTPSGATSTDVYGIVTGFNGVVEIDDTYYNQYTVWAGSDMVVNIVENNGTNDTLTKGNLVTFKPTTDNTYKDNTVFSTTFGTAVYVKEYDENDQLLTYFTSKSGSAGNWVGESAVTKAVADDVVIVYVDVDADAAGSEIGVNGFDTVEGYKNAIVVEDSDHVITHIIVETSGKADIA